MAHVSVLRYRSIVTDIDAEKIDAAIQRERIRLVALLRALADKIETAPTERVTDGLTCCAASAHRGEVLNTGAR